MFRLKNKILFLILAGCAACRQGDHNEVRTIDVYLDKEIADRVELLSKDTTFANDVTVLNKNVNNLLFLTVDIENINASIIKSNQYFAEAPKLYEVDTAGFVKIYRGLPLPEIIATIKRNHLNLLNKIIIRQNKNGTLMYTAQ